MPSEATDPNVLQALAEPLAAFRSVLAATVEQARGALAAQRNDESEEAAELGPFAEQRIDTGRFASLLSRRRALDASALESMGEAFATLVDLAARPDALCDVDVEPGASPRDAVARRLAEIGRAFGAARVFELARAGRYREEEHACFLRAFPFAHWNRSERASAPPLVVHVDGRDLRADGLAEFLDGSLKVVFVARGESPMAPLIRLLTPRVFVLQTGADGCGLDRLAAWEGPGVAALLPAESARFSHDPAAGSDLSDRIAIEHLPEASPPGFLGGRSAAQQRDELAQLAACAKRPEAGAPGSDGAAAASVADPADKLAAWLLARAELGDLG